MCGYKDQSGLEFAEKKLIFRRTEFNLAERIAHADWNEPLEEMAITEKAPLKIPGVGGIGDFFVVHKRDTAGTFYKDWSKFGLKLPLFPGKDEGIINLLLKCKIPN